MASVNGCNVFLNLHNITLHVYFDWWIQIVRFWINLFNIYRTSPKAFLIFFQLVMINFNSIFKYNRSAIISCISISDSEPMAKWQKLYSLLYFLAALSTALLGIKTTALLIWPDHPFFHLMKKCFISTQIVSATNIDSFQTSKSLWSLMLFIKFIRYFIRD
jgi:hypothetical protein